MSFSATIKDEVSKLEATRVEDLAELSAILRNSATINNTIKITIENNSIARKIFKLFRNIYDIIPIVTVRRRYGFSNNLIYILEITKKK